MHSLPLYLGSYIRGLLVGSGVGAYVFSSVLFCICSKTSGAVFTCMTSLLIKTRKKDMTDGPITTEGTMTFLIRERSWNLEEAGVWGSGFF